MGKIDAKPSRRLYIKGRLLILLEDGREAFVKVNDSCLSDGKRHAARLAARERVCLDVLRGLAVPALVRLPKGQLRRALGFEPSSHLAENHLRGKPLHKAKLKPVELLGCWLFMAEHLVAFRRHQILYTDCKPANILVQKKPLRVTFIDFNYATAASLGASTRRTPSDTRPASRLQNTALVPP